MRIHFGISKYIKPKKIIEILGFLVVLALIILGFVPHAYAWTNLGTQNFFTGYETKIMKTNNTYDEETYTGDSGDFTRSSISSGYRISLFQSGTYEVPPKERNIRLAATTTYLSNSTNGNHLTQSHSWFFDNNDYCQNTTTDLGSMHFQFRLYTYNLSNSSTHWNDFLINDILTTLRVKMSAFTEENIAFITTCNVSRIQGENSRFLVDCPGVFQGNYDVEITHFSIDFLNGVPFGNRVLSSNSSYSITYQPMIESTIWRYECTNDTPPIVHNSYPYEDENGNLNDIYSYMQTNYNSNIPGIDESLINLNYPATFRELLTLPLQLLRTIVANSDTCTNYTIDLSSISQKWGGGNYTLSLPCMRSVLQHHLGIYYNLADILLAFFVFYNIAMSLITLINAITNGDDLYDYLFKTSSNDNINDTTNNSNK